MTKEAMVRQRNPISPEFQEHCNDCKFHPCEVIVAGDDHPQVESCKAILAQALKQHLDTSLAADAGKKPKGKRWKRNTK